MNDAFGKKGRIWAMHSMCFMKCSDQILSWWTPFYPINIDISTTVHHYTASDLLCNSQACGDVNDPVSWAHQSLSISISHWKLFCTCIWFRSTNRSFSYTLYVSSGAREEGARQNSHYHIHLFPYEHHSVKSKTYCGNFIVWFQTALSLHPVSSSQTFFIMHDCSVTLCTCPVVLEVYLSCYQAIYNFYIQQQINSKPTHIPSRFVVLTAANQHLSNSARSVSPIIKQVAPSKYSI